MASDFRSVSVTSYELREDTVISAPAGLQNGDFLILVVVLTAPTTPPTPTLPEGFQLFEGFPVEEIADDVTLHVRIAWKLAEDEPADYTIEHDLAVSQAMLISFSGGDPEEEPLITINEGEGTTSTALGLTTPTNNSVVAFIAQNWQGYAGIADPPVGNTPTFTERVDDISAVSVLYLATGVLATAGATGDKSHANGNADSDPWSAYLLTVPAEPSEPPEEGFNAAWAIGSNAVIL